MKSFQMNSSRWSSALLAAGWFLCTPMVPAQTDPQLQWNEDYRKKYEVPTGTYVGRSPYMRSSMEMGEPMPPPPPPPAPTPNSSSARITISKAMPDMVTAGEEFPVTLTVQ